MKFGGAHGLQIPGPKPDEVLEDAANQVDAVDESVAEKEHEELVVGERHAVVHPRTVVVHLKSDFFNISTTINGILYLKALFTRNSNAAALIVKGTSKYDIH